MNFEHCEVEVRIIRSDGAVITVDLEQADFTLDLARNTGAEPRALGAYANLKVKGIAKRLGGAEPAIRRRC